MSTDDVANIIVVAKCYTHTHSETFSYRKYCKHFWNAARPITLVDRFKWTRQRSDILGVSVMSLSEFLTGFDYIHVMVM